LFSRSRDQDFPKLYTQDAEIQEIQFPTLSSGIREGMIDSFDLANI